MKVYVLRTANGMYYADGCPTPSILEARKFTRYQNAQAKADWVSKDDPELKFEVREIVLPGFKGRYSGEF